MMWIHGYTLSGFHNKKLSYTRNKKKERVCNFIGDTDGPGIPPVRVEGGGVERKYFINHVSVSWDFGAADLHD